MLINDREMLSILFELNKHGDQQVGNAKSRFQCGAEVATINKHEVKD
jgi:hypothetical protein